MGPQMRILWLSFVDAAQNAPYFELLSRYLNDIAAPGTTVDVAGTSPPDRDFGRLTEFRCAALAIDRCIEAEAQGYDAFVIPDPRLVRDEQISAHLVGRNHKLILRPALPEEQLVPIP